MPETDSAAALLEAARSFRPRILADRERLELSPPAGGDRSGYSCPQPMAGSISRRLRA